MVSNKPLLLDINDTGKNLIAKFNKKELPKDVMKMKMQTLELATLIN